MTHRFGDESSPAPPPTLSRLGAAAAAAAAAADNYGLHSQAKKHTTLRQTVVPWLHMPEPVRIRAEDPCREREDGSLFLNITTSELLTSFTL